MTTKFQNLAILIGLSCSFCAYAQGGAAITLEKIQVIQEQEKSGDELYLHITEFSDRIKSRNYTIPTRPSHWLSRHLDKIQNIPLWKAEQGACASKEVLISLIEEDIEPWNINDLIGSVLVKVKCENNKTVTEIAIPEGADTTQSTTEPNAYILNSHRAKYLIKLKVE